jgi:hypothetical protein
MKDRSNVVALAGPSATADKIDPARNRSFALNADFRFLHLFSEGTLTCENVPTGAEKGGNELNEHPIE